MTTRTYTVDQPAQPHKLFSDEVKLSNKAPNGAQYLITPWGWRLLGNVRWLWLLDGVFYLEDDSTLTPGFPVRGVAAAPAVNAVTPAAPGFDRAPAIAAINDARADLERALRALAQ